jgi:LemA protein
MNAWIVPLIVGVVVFATTLAPVVYNRLVVLKARCDNAFAQIEVQLKRRYDLVPNLVECVRGLMVHERETLERVIAARNQAVAGLADAARQPENPEALKAMMGAEGSLAVALGRLTAVIENDPDLKASASVAELTEELTTTENRIAYARLSYNDWVTGFNTYRQGFPACVYASLFGFDHNRSYLEFAEGAKLAQAPRVVLT